MEIIMFDFRIITCADGTEIVDRTLKTPYNALTPLQMVEYMEMDAQIAIADRLERKERAETEHKRKISRNLLYRLACLCGLV